MTNKPFYCWNIFSILIGISSIWSCSGETKPPDQTEAKPNIVVILTDDQQFDAAAFNGNTVIRTPAIDRLATQSRRFTQANVAFALCSPSRAAILTGRYGSANGVLELNIFRELYDQQTDPLEMNNLADRPEYADNIQQLERYLTKHQQNILQDKS